MIRWITLAFAAFLLQGCTALNQDARINFMEGQMKDVLQKSAEWDVTTKDVRTKMADYGAQLDTIREQMQILSGRLEEMEAGSTPRENPIFLQQGLSTDVRSLKERLQVLEAQVADLERQIEAGEPSAVKIPPAGETAPPPSVSKVSETKKLAPLPVPKEEKKTPPVSDDKKAYDLAMESIKQKEFEKAIRLFRNFIKKFPDNELNDNAQYWIGESYYAQKKFEEAIIEFEEVIQQYPKGDKIPAALLKEGLAFHELKDNNPARQILKKLIDQYPESDEAKLAQEKLKEIQ